MTKLEELIQELCPDGVEYKPLSDIATDIYRGSGIKRDQVTETGIPCVRYGEIYTSYNVWFHIHRWSMFLTRNILNMETYCLL